MKTLRKYLEERLDIIYKNDFEVKYFKNPTKEEMNYISEDARGIIFSNGDIYVQSIHDPDKAGGRREKVNAFIHDDLVKWLLEKEDFDINTEKHLNNSLTQRDYFFNIYDFLCVQRSGVQNTFLLGESYSVYRLKEKEKNIELIKTFGEKCKEKNPHLSFDFYKANIKKI